MNEHSPHYAQVKAYYDGGYWDTNRVRNAVVKNWITPEEFYEITGEPYESK